MATCAEPRDPSTVLAACRARYEPRNTDEEMLVELLSRSAVQIDRCVRLSDSLRTYHARRAGVCWDADRRAEAEEIASRLKRDPARTVARLKRKGHGVDWLLERWAILEDVLTRNVEWTEKHDALARDLLALPELARDRKPWEAVGLSTASELVAREIQALKRHRREALDELDVMEQAAARDGIPIETPRPIAAVDREQSAWMRHYLWARSRLESHRRERIPPAQPIEPPTPLPERTVVETPPPRPPIGPAEERTLEIECTPRPMENAARGPSPVALLDQPSAPASRRPKNPRLADVLDGPLPGGNRHQRRALARLLNH